MWWLPSILPMACLALPTFLAHRFLRVALSGNFWDLSELAPWVWVIFGTVAGSFWLADSLVVRRRKELRGALLPTLAVTVAIFAAFATVLAGLIFVGQLIL